MSDVAVCSICKTEQNLSDFHKDRSRKNGHDHRCMECKRGQDIKRGAIPKNIPPEKQCPVCSEVKFSKMFRKNNFRSDGLSYWCSDCQNKYQKEDYQQRQQREDWPMRSYLNQIKSRYKITKEFWCELYDKQNGKCSICNTKLENKFKNIEGLNATVDHCHSLAETKEVNKTIRGLLCKKCNTGLGHFNDSPALLTKALNYIDKFNEDFYERETEKEKTEEYGEGEESQVSTQEHQHSFKYQEPTQKPPS
jgi:hypothetical protein